MTLAAEAPLDMNPTAIQCNPLLLVDVEGDMPSRRQDAIMAGISRGNTLPEIDCEPFDLLLTTVPDAPQPWVCVADANIDAVGEALAAALRRNPLATLVLSQVLRINDSLAFEAALLVESMAYSTLLGGAEFRAWLSARGKPAAIPNGLTRVRCERDGDLLTVWLCNPQRGNAMDARMRDELLEALCIAEADLDLRVELRAEGVNFCSGGDLDEFGSASDPALAHAIRTRHSVCRSLHGLGERATSYLQGACIGAGIEVPAAARIVADSSAWFRLPELAMGLIPGAGGTASLPRRVSRQRFLYWAMTNSVLDARRALDWGLVDEIRNVP